MSENRTTASFTELVRQASVTSAEYLYKAIKNIDEELGKGFAAKNTDLLSAVIHSSTSDYNNASFQKTFELFYDVLESLVIALDRNENTIEGYYLLIIDGDKVKNRALISQCLKGGYYVITLIEPITGNHNISKIVSTEFLSKHVIIHPNNIDYVMDDISKHGWLRFDIKF